MKIMRGHGSFADRQDLHARGFYRNHVVDILESAFDQQEFSSDYSETVLPKQVRRDDCIGDAGFVFESEENESFRRARTLASNNSAGYADVGSIANGCEINGAENTQPVKFSTIVRDRMRPNGHTGAAEVGD